MNSTPTPETDPTTAALAIRPAALALSASTEAVRDSLAHMDHDAVFSVPIGTPSENFDVVEWCAANRKPVINRFDPWPLETLMVQNAPSDDSNDVAAPAASPPDRWTRRSGARRFRLNRATGDRTLDRAWHSSNVATTRSRIGVGVI